MTFISWGTVVRVMKQLSDKLPCDALCVFSCNSIARKLRQAAKSAPLDATSQGNHLFPQPHQYCDTLRLVCFKLHLAEHFATSLFHFHYTDSIQRSLGTREHRTLVTISVLFHLVQVSTSLPIHPACTVGWLHFELWIIARHPETPAQPRQRFAQHQISENWPPITAKTIYRSTSIRAQMCRHEPLT